ncbi:MULTISPECIES: urease accessory protein UreD [unclassified Bradyrhizobium]|uniref:urease accessory protein UreD n=1 Tax=unclassified Bradyrhizobium TaxID=2631580 RepID=UPI0029162793|nr:MULTISPECIES: urease accessory protein UreD [unclassified Bradyrhizobium]
MRSPLLSCSTFEGRTVEAVLSVDHAGGRSILRRQHVGYPLHVTRGFYLDAARPDLLTLYLQSASGGLYAGDRLALDLIVTRGGAFHLTTQAATVVHDGRGIGAAQRQTIKVEGGAFCAVTTDPYLLFPGAELALETIATVADDAVFCVADGFAMHDPRARGRSFSAFSGRLRVARPDGRLLLHDAGRVSGDELQGALGPLAASANLVLVATPDRLPSLQALQQAADACGALSGASPAPNEAGLVLRILAPEGGTLARAMEAAFHVAADAALGVKLARRRK